MKEKRLIKLFIVTLLFFCMPLFINAEIPAEINDSSVRIRSAATTSSDILATVNSGTSISLVDKTKHTGAGCSDGWYNIIYKSKNAYVCSTYVTIIDNSFANTGINVVDYTARINSNNVTIRKSATTSSSSVATLSLGVNVEIQSTKTVENSGCSSNKWYKIMYYNNKTGYVCSKYVSKKSSITATDEEYAAALRTAGFPESYIPYLTYLHNKYPNWKFTAKNTKLNFATAVDAEEGKNYMQTTNNNYRTSTTPAEGSSWFKVNEGVIAFYMDPRNWLTKERIFMFEKLDFEDAYDEQYPALIKNIFGDGKLGADKYTNPMYTYSKQYGISPTHVASRIRLEVGANGSDSTSGGEFTYKGKTYSGYYNFFNIGAYEQDGYSAITMGLVKAKNNGWNTIAKAIKGGVEFLANGYINQGQGTLYYQKFNVRPKATYSTYTHQYMTNIQAPATEGNQTYSSYKSAGILTQSFIFEIPVYKNMPSYTSLPDAGDSNNNLSTLKVEGYTLSPAFDKDVIAYEVMVNEDVTELTINADSESTKATVTGTGKMKIDSDNTIITITVKPQVGNEKKYTINVIKQVSNDTTNDNTETNNNTNTNTNTDTNTNTNNDSNTTTSNTNTQTTVTDINKIMSNAKIKLTNNNITSIKYDTKASVIIDKLISNGAKKVVIKDSNKKEIKSSALIGTGYTISITNEKETKSYIVIIKGDTSGDGKVNSLDLLQVLKHMKGDKKLKNYYLTAGDTSGDDKVNSLDLLQVLKHIKGDKKL